MSCEQVLRGEICRHVTGHGTRFIRVSSAGPRAAFFGAFFTSCNTRSDCEWILSGWIQHPIRFIDTVRERLKKGIRSLGRSRAGQTTKFHLALSPSGVVSWYIGPGNEGDARAIQNLWAFWDWTRILAVIADMAYDTNAIRAILRHHAVECVIPPNPRRVTQFAYDESLYATRKRIECNFGYQKENKRIYSRFDKLDCTFAAFHACAFIKRILC